MEEFRKSLSDLKEQDGSRANDEDHFNAYKQKLSDSGAQDPDSQFHAFHSKMIQMVNDEFTNKADTNGELAEKDTDDASTTSSHSHPQDVRKALLLSLNDMESLVNNPVPTEPLDSAYVSPMVRSEKSGESEAGSEGSLPSLALRNEEATQSQCSISSFATGSSFSTDQDTDFQYPPVEPIVEYFESKVSSNASSPQVPRKENGHNCLSSENIDKVS